MSHEPHALALARFLARRGGLRHVIATGMRDAATLRRFAGEFSITVLGFAEDSAEIGTTQGTQVSLDPTGPFPSIPADVQKMSVVMLDGVLGRFTNVGPFVRSLKSVCEMAPYVLIAEPERGLAPSPHGARRREWNLHELVQMLRSEGLEPAFTGLTNADDSGRKGGTMLALLGREVTFVRSTPVRCCAIVHAYNEADVIEECLRHLTEQGLDVILVDNWSTDGTYDQALKAQQGNPGILVRRFPDRPTTQYQWKRQLEETVRIAESSGYDWILHNDADELRSTPWEGVRLADGFAFANALGYSAIDFTVLDFRYLVSQRKAASIRDLTHFEFGRRPGHFVQIKAWRNQRPGAVDLASSGGHEARFEGRRVFPLKFLLKHYPLRNEAQAREKIQRDRMPRTVQENRALGWHTQYQNFPEAQFRGWNAEALIPWDAASFPREYLVERISGIGLGQEA